MRGVGRWLWAKRLTVYIVVISAVLVWALGVMQSNQRVLQSNQSHTDEVAAEAALLTEENSRQNDAIAKVVSDLENETKARTAQGCKNTSDRQDTYRNALLNLIAVSLPKDQDGNPVPLPPAQQARIDAFIAQINQDLPHLICPLDEGNIVIATPSTTAPGG